MKRLCLFLGSLGNADCLQASSHCRRRRIHGTDYWEGKCVDSDADGAFTVPLKQRELIRKTVKCDPEEAVSPRKGLRELEVAIELADTHQPGIEHLAQQVHPNQNR